MKECWQSACTQIFLKPKSPFRLSLTLYLSPPSRGNASLPLFYFGIPLPPSPLPPYRGNGIQALFCFIIPLLIFRLLIERMPELNNCFFSLPPRHSSPPQFKENANLVNFLFQPTTKYFPFAS